MLAEEWATGAGIQPVRYPAVGEPPRCYHARNAAMAEDCGRAVLCALWPKEGAMAVLDDRHDDNRGTRAMMRELEKRCKPYRLYAVDERARRIYLVKASKGMKVEVM